MRFNRGLWRKLPGAGAIRVRPRATALLLFLFGANLTVWAWALTVFGHNPVLLGTALLAYGLGLRHAVDADHIAAIDCVTRKLLEQPRYSVGVGFFFSLGHSTVVVLATVAIVLGASFYERHLEALHRVGGLVGTLISAAFLLAIAFVNFRIFLQGRRKLEAACPSEAGLARAIDVTANGGLLARILRPIFRLVSRSWHMYPVGLLFGLGFDTATEVSLLGISAAEMANGLPASSIFVFPALFAAGMSLVDTADGVMMLGLYGWAFPNPIRRLRYNIGVTLVSALAASLVATIELLGLVGFTDSLLSHAVQLLNTHFETIGLIIVGLFISCWLAVLLVQKLRGEETLDVVAPAS